MDLPYVKQDSQYYLISQSYRINTHYLDSSNFVGEELDLQTDLPYSHIGVCSLLLELRKIAKGQC